MATRNDLHKLIDQLSEDELATAQRILRCLRLSGASALVLALDHRGWAEVRREGPPTEASTDGGPPQSLSGPQ